MRNRQVRFPHWLVVVAMALPMMAIGTARADQIEIGNAMPAAPVVQETRLGFASVTFEVVNTGVPTFFGATIGPLLSETLTAKSGDTNLDVIATGSASGCSAPLGVGASCTITARYFILDADPFDKKENDPGDTATWTFGISVPWTVESTTGTATDSVTIIVKDDPIPEPGTLLTLTSGILGLAGMARKRLFR